MAGNRHTTYCVFRESEKFGVLLEYFPSSPICNCTSEDVRAASKAGNAIGSRGCATDDRLRKQAGWGC
jgi:hypothetical protein